MVRDYGALARAIVGRDTPDAVQWFGAVVTAASLGSPYTCTVRLADGTALTGVTCLGWYTPVVGHVVHVMKAGPRVLVLGPIAPVSPTPPAPGPAPTPEPSTRVAYVQPVDAATWVGGAWETDRLQQGGPDARAWWFYGTGIATARAGGTIVAASVYVQRAPQVHGATTATARLGTHTQGTRPVSGSAALGNVAAAGGLELGQAKVLPLSAAQLAALNAGAAGLGLEPGSASFTGAEFLRATIGGASGALSLTIQT